MVVSCRHKKGFYRQLDALQKSNNLKHSYISEHYQRYCTGLLKVESQTVIKNNDFVKAVNTLPLKVLLVLLPHFVLLLRTEGLNVLASPTRIKTIMDPSSRTILIVRTKPALPLVYFTPIPKYNLPYFLPPALYLNTLSFDQFEHSFPILTTSKKI